MYTHMDTWTLRVIPGLLKRSIGFRFYGSIGGSVRVTKLSKV